MAVLSEKSNDSLARITHINDSSRISATAYADLDHCDVDIGGYKQIQANQRHLLFGL